MLRAWQDVINKWRLVPDAVPDEPAAYAERARSALVSGDLDVALREFSAAEALRDHPLDSVGIGDVHLARGAWAAADEHYRKALDSGGLGALMAKLGMAQVLIGRGMAAAAVADLELLVADRPDDEVLRHYLASAWFSAAEQCRAHTDDAELVIATEDQLDVCGRAAERILNLDIDDDELRRGARALRDEVAAGRRWTWRPEGIAVSLAVLTVAFGLVVVVVGGLLDSAMVMLAGVVVGGAVLFVVVHQFRRQAWRRRATELAPRISHPGI